MIDRGSCNFVTKTRNVQNINGHLALIVNNEDGPVDNILLKDDGTGSDILIPSVLISKADGDKIKQYLIQNKDKNNKFTDIIISVEFKIVK
jgi:extracellular elastinolytic metalloproteinase